MGAVIGQILTYGLGVAISPIPVIAAILMLLSPRARSTSVGFLLGWLVGIIVPVIVFTALSSFLPESDADASHPISGVIKIVLGVLLLVLAVRQWAARPRNGAEPTMPKWMAAIDSFTAAKAFGLGVLLAAVNPKNLLMSIGAGLAVGNAALPVGQTAVVLLIYVLLAACTVLVPVIGFLIAGDRLAHPLAELRIWLTANNVTIMTILLLVLGVAVIGKGLASF